MNRETLRSVIKKLLDDQSFAVLSTLSDDDAPHSTIVCFSSADELETLVFVTPQTTRKFANLLVRPKATLFIDDRSGFMGNLKDIWAIEARGIYREASSAEASSYRSLFLKKYPELAEFVDAPSSVMCLLDVRSYDVVHQFQDVMRLFPGDRQ